MAICHSKQASRVPGSPCQGSWRRRRLRGSHNVLFSPSASLTLGSSLVRGSRESQNAHLAEETKRPKINSPRAPGSPCQGSWRRRRLRGSRNDPFSPSASLALGSSLSLAGTRQLPRQREPRKRKYSFSRENHFNSNKFSLFFAKTLDTGLGIC